MVSQYTAFEEEGSGSELVFTLFIRGKHHAGHTVTAMEVMSMLAPGDVRTYGLKTQVLNVIDFWTVFFPLD